MVSINLLSILPTSALLGILCHISIVNIEFELYLFHFLITYVLTYFGLNAALIPGDGVWAAWLKTTVGFSSFNVGVLLSISVYRLLFHRCRRFPGPLAAKVTRFYAAYLNLKEYQYTKELGKLHEEYGDFVRIGTAVSSRHRTN